VSTPATKKHLSRRDRSCLDRALAQTGAIWPVWYSNSLGRVVGSGPGEIEPIAGVMRVDQTRSAGR
jgi:hypothetical protein